MKKKKILKLKMKMKIKISVEIQKTDMKIKRYFEYYLNRSNCKNFLNKNYIKHFLVLVSKIYK